MPKFKPRTKKYVSVRNSNESILYYSDIAELPNRARVDEKPNCFIIVQLYCFNSGD